jgi:acyl dehydratase
MSVDPEKARGHVICEEDYVFNQEMCALYSLCIGFNKDPLNEDHFKFIYEYDDEYTTFPTISVLALKVCLIKMFDTPGLPQFNIMNLLHGEQIVESYKPIPPGTTVKAQAILADLVDKGKGMLMTVKINLKDKENDDELFSTSYYKFYVRNLGGFGDKGKLDQPIPNPPEREPDAIMECPTEINLALYYRNCGDVNPLHIVPSAAQLAGFDKPILHGLCTYGIVARAVFDTYCQGDVSLIKTISTRFVSHVYPGETIVVDMFKEANMIYFSARTKERELKISTGCVELKMEAKL